MAWNVTVLAEIEEKAASLVPYQIGLTIHRLVFPVIVPIGLLGNILSLAIMLQKHNRRVSFCVYLAALAFSDSFLLIQTSYDWLSSVPFQLGARSVSCNVSSSFFQFSTSASVIFIVFVTLDRFLAACHPFRSVDWRTPTRATIAIVAVIPCSMITSVPYALMARQVNYFTCAAFANGETMSVVFSLVYLVLFAIIPLTAVLVMNVAIARSASRHQTRLLNLRLWQSGNHVINGDDPIFSTHSSSDVTNEAADGIWRTDRQVRSHLSSSYYPRGRPVLVDHQVSRVLLRITVFLFCLVTPQFVRYVTFVFINYRTSPDLYATYILIYHISNKLYTANSAIIFFVYCITGSRFRNDLKVLLKPFVNCLKRVYCARRRDKSLKNEINKERY